METKPQVKSKINWVALGMILVSLGSYLGEYDWASIVGPDTEKLIVGGLGALIYVLRTHFSGMPVKGLIR